ncbi:hypothetical protein [Silanimonas sp.]|uniref:hypothetical protein n=1 Tax=Silanimonas sp. TaxID=1929290 RepID=UPI001BC77945|nr:hypothetical protein [Silanimonas sp.]MBS3895314.1 hypothetical protein [Silanimonas sp.]MBS3923702.1 hypothetical protein [Xanthomonadaceae bacterium]
MATGTLLAPVALIAFLLLLIGAVSAGEKEEQQVEHLTPEEFLKLEGPEEFERLTREAEDAIIAALGGMPPTIERNGSAILFSGHISHQAVDALDAAIAVAPTTELHIRSAGGTVLAGHRMGRLVHQHRLAVVVDQYCNSGCANYVFTAGARRVIAEGAVVVWHGNTLQKNFREFDQCGRTVSSFDGIPMPPEEVAARGADSTGRARAQVADLEFFRGIGVDDYITRVGQEPRFFGNFTLSVDDMARFGVTGVEAPPGYGSAEFCREINHKRPYLNVHCVAVTDQMLAYEQTRRVMGEICQSDGTLRIRTERD